ncbi:Vacuolar protein 8 A (Vac8A) [Monocercomonoides exilis]|uniref:Vacuolar protein 8 A (Vac8A) n=1 Tax=Monocercomonoides exilis TaxID=2049356 RepID=UPI00355A8DA5|nr:Vacuolar protein 8 A (Vac8A) [Monocercomonoides exilis]|eukprot:MONOS_10516.1-p1 / transcript=MONOS_10516.1 / gene=MONOS_10516 / organism=Monocercomonoides_exilis_PA203 / gene_product=Vacuolar protein 8 A (Vac8A) / transcript_product=Vacuolar protein 8 A (Vac8A) / location=Mono_scaffold00481:22525-26509(+) / protein_length=1284 / sequence_SO=supercontig / SO=protein_coding / is_pseudo=false
MSSSRPSTQEDHRLHSMQTSRGRTSFSRERKDSMGATLSSERRSTSHSPRRKRNTIEYFKIHDETSTKAGLDRRAMPNHRPPENLLMWDTLSAMNDDYEQTKAIVNSPLKSQREEFLTAYEKFVLESTSKSTKGSQMLERSIGGKSGTLTEDKDTTKYDPADDKVESDDEGYDELNLRRNTKAISEGNNPDFGRIYKAVSVISEGNIPVVNVACASILEADLSKPCNQLAIRDCGGLPHLCKYLTAKDEKLRGSVGEIFRRIAANPFIQAAMHDSHEVKMVVDTIVKDECAHVQAVGLDAAARLMAYHRNRRIVRENGGIQVAVRVLNSAKDKERLTAASNFIWMASKSKNCRRDASDLKILPIIIKTFRHFANSTEGVPPMPASSVRPSSLLGGAQTSSQTTTRDALSGMQPIKGVRSPSLSASSSLSASAGSSTRRSSQITSSAKRSSPATTTKGVPARLPPLSSSSSTSASTANLSALSSSASASSSATVTFIPPPPKQATGTSNAELQQFFTHQQQYATQRFNPSNLEGIKALTGALANFALDKENRGILVEHHTLLEMMRLLKWCSDTETLTLAVRCLGWCCCEEPKGQKIIRELGCLNLLASLFSQKEPHLLVALSTAVGHASADEDCAELLIKSVLPVLLDLLKSSDTRIQIHAAGAIEKLAHFASGKKMIREKGGLLFMIRLLHVMNDKLLINVCNALAECAEEKESIAIIAQNDGLRLLWSLFRSSNLGVITAAAFVLTPLLADPNNAAVVGRNYVGALSQIVELLTIKDDDVRAATCSVIANLAKDDDENLAVLVEVGLMPLLAMLTLTKNDSLKRRLCDAITSVCRTEENALLMGKLGGVVPLVSFLKDGNRKMDAINQAEQSEKEKGIRQTPKAAATTTRSSSAPLTSSSSLKSTMSSTSKNGALKTTKRNDLSYSSSSTASADQFSTAVHRERAKASLVLTLRSIARAIRAVSFDRTNSHQLRAADCVSALSVLLLSLDAPTQDAAADAISNIRRWHITHKQELAAEERMLQPQKGMTGSMTRQTCSYVSLKDDSLNSDAGIGGGLVGPSHHRHEDESDIVRETLSAVSKTTELTGVARSFRIPPSTRKKMEEALTNREVMTPQMAQQLLWEAQEQEKEERKLREARGGRPRPGRKGLNLKSIETDAEEEAGEGEGEGEGEEGMEKDEENTNLTEDELQAREEEEAIQNEKNEDSSELTGRQRSEVSSPSQINSVSPTSSPPPQKESAEGELPNRESPSPVDGSEEKRADSASQAEEAAEQAQSYQEDFQ